MLRTSSLRAALAPVLISLLAPSAGLPQAPAEDVRFKIQSNSVVVDVVVTDSKGKTITGLTVDDFKLTENGTPQKITGFEGPPAEREARKTAAPAAETAAAPQTRAAGQYRLVTLVMDVGDMRATGLLASTKAASEYIEKSILTEDYVAIYAIGPGMRLVVPYTRDKKRLLEGIRAIGASGNQGIYTARDRERTLNDIAKLQSDVAGLQNAGDIASKALADMAAMERLSLMAEMSQQNSFQARSVFGALRAIAAGAAMLPGRKNVIVFSEGFLHSDLAEEAMNAVVSAANRGNVSIYVVDPSGASANQNNFSGGAGAENQSNSAPMGAGGGGRTPNTRASQQGEFARMGPQVVGGQTKFDMAKQAMALDSQGSDMADIAASTGGFIVRGNSPLTSLERIDRDLRDHYTLTYQPAETNFDGKFRPIKVEVAGKGYRVRYRKGYWAVAPGDNIAMMTPAAAQLAASIANGSLKPSITAKLNAALVFEDRTGHAVPFSVWLPGEDSWTSLDPNGGHNAGITVVVTVRDAQGRMLDAYQKFVDFQSTKEQWKEYQKHGVQLLASLTVPNLEPVDIQAIVQFSNGKAALASTKVPATSSVTGARPTSLVLTSFVEMAKKDSMPIIPALRLAEYDVVLPKEPQFAASGKLTLYFGLAGVAIEPSSGRPLIGLAVAIKSGDKVVRELPALDGLYPWPKSQDRLFFLKQFELAGLAPGAYTVETTVKDRSTNSTAVQSAAFTVR